MKYPGARTGSLPGGASRARRKSVDPRALRRALRLLKEHGFPTELLTSKFIEVGAEKGAVAARERVDDWLRGLGPGALNALNDRLESMPRAPT
jgi:hypothetical protein